MLSQPAQVGNRLLRFAHEGKVTGEHRVEKLTLPRLVYNLSSPTNKKCRSALN